MRTAITTALTHSGQSVLIFGREKPLVEQKEELRKFKGLRFHAKYSLIAYQESDGHEQLMRFRTEKAHAEHEELRAKETEAQKKQAAAFDQELKDIASGKTNKSKEKK